MSITMPFFLASASDFEIQMAMNIYNGLLPYAFLFSVVGLAISVYMSKSDPAGIALAIVIGGTCVALLAGFPTGVQKLQVAFQEKADEISAKADKFTEIWNQDIKEPNGGGLYKSIQNAFCYSLYKLFQAFGYLGFKLIKWVQPFALNCMIAMAPITLCMYQIPPLRGIAFNTLMTTFGILLWPIGTCFADFFIAKIGLELFAGIGFGATGAAVVGIVSWPSILAGFFIMAIFMNLLYLAVPVGISAILKGASPMASIGAAAFMTASAMPLARSMSQLSSSIGNLGKMLSGATSSSGGGGGAGGGLSVGAGASESNPETAIGSRNKMDAWSFGNQGGGGSGGGGNGGGSSGGGSRSNRPKKLEGPIIDADIQVISEQAESFAAERNALLAKNGVFALDYKHNSELDRN